MACSVRGSYPGISRPLTCEANDAESAPTVRDARLDPSASSEPSGVPRSPISSRTRSSAVEWPNRSHGASIRPRSAHSIAHAIVPPAEIVSMPSSSQRALATSTASGSLTPHIGPSAKTFSYSTRAFVPPRER